MVTAICFIITHQFDANLVSQLTKQLNKKWTTFNPMGPIDAPCLQIHTQSSWLNFSGHIYWRWQFAYHVTQSELRLCLVCVSKCWREFKKKIYFTFKLCVHFHTICSWLNTSLSLCLFTTFSMSLQTAETTIYNDVSGFSVRQIIVE